MQSAKTSKGILVANFPKYFLVTLFDQEKKWTVQNSTLSLSSRFTRDVKTGFFLKLTKVCRRHFCISSTSWKTVNAFANEVRREIPGHTLRFRPLKAALQFYKFQVLTPSTIFIHCSKHSTFG